MYAYRVDSIRAKKGEDADIPASVHDRVNTTGPSALNVYLLHHNVVYKGCVTAKDVTNKIVDGAHLTCEDATLTRSWPESSNMFVGRALNIFMCGAISSPLRRGVAALISSA